MASNLADELLQLVADTKTQIISEFKSGDWLISDPETHEFFVRYATSKKSAPTKPPSQQLKGAKAPSAPAPASVPPQPLPQAREQNNKTQTIEHKPIKVNPAVTKPRPPAAISQALPSPKNQVKPKRWTGHHFDLEPTVTTEVRDFSQLKKIYQKLFPDCRLLENPPESPSKTSRPPVELAILVRASTAAEQTLLNSMTKAINQKLLPAALLPSSTVASSEQWTQLRQHYPLKICICDAKHLKLLRSFYPDSSESDELGGVRIVQMEPLDVYLKNPKEKLTLWNQLLAAKEKQSGAQV